MTNYTEAIANARTIQAENLYKEQAKEDARVLEMHILSEVCKTADRMLDKVDFEVAKNVDTQYIADELAEYIVEQFQ